MMLLRPERVLEVSRRNSCAVRKSTKIDTLLGSVPTTGFWVVVFFFSEALGSRLKLINSSSIHFNMFFHSANVSVHIEEKLSETTLGESCC